MNKDQFIFWLKGFARAVNEEGPTPKQWETIVSELNQIKDCPNYGSPIDSPNLIPFVQPVHLGTTGGSGVTFTTTPNSGGTVTYNPSTTTLWNPSGSNWSYTSTLPQQPKVDSNQLELDLN